MRLSRMFGLIVILCLVGLACNGDGPNGPTGDKTPPTVVSVLPPDNGTLDLHDGRIEISATFSEPVDTGTIDAASFFITSFPIDPLNPITGSYWFDGVTIGFLPDSQLEYSTWYEATLSTAITDTAGNHLAQAYTWSFTTEVDPNTLPPTVVSTVPASAQTNVDATAPISITFDKGMNPTAFTFDIASTQSLGFTATWASATTVVIDLDAAPQYSTEYTATINTATADTFGIHLAEPYIWSFTTGVDPMIPTVMIVRPEPQQIIGDTVTITALAGHPVGVARVEFYVDGYHVPAADDFSEPWAYLWDATSLAIGSSHEIYVKAYDAQERVGVSDTLSVIYLWEKLLQNNDPNDDWQTDIKMIYARSTDSLLELRVETWEDWFDPYDSVLNDTTLDLAMYIDADHDIGTGRTFLGLPTHPLNGIGADYQSIVGIHGNKAFSQFIQGADSFVVVYDPTEIPYLNWPADTNVYEIGLAWSYFGGSYSLRLVAINAFYTAPEFPIFDWVPNEGQGYLTIVRQNRYIGATGGASSPRPSDIRLSQEYPNPFGSVKLRPTD
ncbi:MAG: Ig-like domain-containing protein [bacterium]